jgi:hypothetical protein
LEVAEAREARRPEEDDDEGDKGGENPPKPLPCAPSGDMGLPPPPPAVPLAGERRRLRTGEAAGATWAAAPCSLTVLTIFSMALRPDGDDAHTL